MSDPMHDADHFDRAAECDFDMAAAKGQAMVEIDALTVGLSALAGTKRCERCATTDGVELESGRTAYHHEPGTEDPNRPWLLCRPCAVEHHAHWDDMWAAARGG